MDIDALTVCAGPLYAGYLRRSLPVWLDTLDSLTVITKPDDRDTIEVCHGRPRLRLVTTDVFTAHGAAFNKGAALDVGYAAMDPVDWVLHFDSDILPPPDWRRRFERTHRVGGVHGAPRYDEKGRLIPDAPPWPYGYFQLWHAADPAAQFWPLFEPWHPHAGSYDLEFLEKWPRDRWHKLNFKVTHFGEVRRNWFGAGLAPEAQREAFRRMDAVHKVGLRNTRMLARRPENRLAVPPPRFRFAFDGHDPAWGREMLRACLHPDPFLVDAYCGRAGPGYERVGMEHGPDHVRARLENP